MMKILNELLNERGLCLHHPLLGLRKQWPFDFIRAYAVKNHVIRDRYEKGTGSTGNELGA